MAAIKVKTLSGPVLAAKMRKDPTTAGWAKKIVSRKKVTQKQLDDMLPDYVPGWVISKFFK